MSRVALQLYTVRAECAHDFRGALEAVAATGYEGVELFDLHGHPVEEVKSWLDELGLVAVGRHAGADALRSGLPGLAAELRVLGTDRLALSWIDPPETEADVRSGVALVSELAARAHGLDLRLGFHNHWGELRPLVDNATMLDLLRELPPELLWLELDLGWIWAAGADPVDQLERTRGRSPLVHVKDLREGREHCPVGDGAVGYERVLPVAVAAGAEWLIVEQDETTAPFDEVARSLAAVNAILGVAA